MGNTGSCSLDLQENCCVEGMGAKSASPFFSSLGNAAGGRFVLGRPVLYQRNLVQRLPLHMPFLHASFQVTWECEFRIYIHIYIYKGKFLYIYMYQFIQYMYIFCMFNL